MKIRDLWINKWTPISLPPPKKKNSSGANNVISFFIRVLRNDVDFRVSKQITKHTITKNRFVSVRFHETPRTESDKHCDQNKANVWAGAAVVILKAKILVNSSVYRSRNKRNGRHQALLLGWLQNRLKISRKMAGITKRVKEIGAESIRTGRRLCMSA